jgi:hypothetical protein
MRNCRLYLDCDLKLIKTIICFGPCPISFYPFYGSNFEETTSKPKPWTHPVGLPPPSGWHHKNDSLLRIPSYVEIASLQIEAQIFFHCK